MIPTARFGKSDRMTVMRKYTDPLAAGYLLEADACRKVLKDLQRSADKYKRKVEKERADRRQEFETVMGYRSEEDIRDAYGWEFITEARFDRYIEIYRNGEKALEQSPPSVNGLTYRILCRIISGIDAEQQEWRFSALLPAEQRAEIERARQAKKEWEEKMCKIRKELGIVRDEPPVEFFSASV